MHHISQTEWDVIAVESTVGGVTVITEDLIVGYIYAAIGIRRKITILDRRLAGIAGQLSLLIAWALPTYTLGRIHGIILTLTLTIGVIVLLYLPALRRS